MGIRHGGIIGLAALALAPGAGAQLVFGPQRTITTAADSAHSVFLGDVDGDGDLDVLSASFNDDRIAWYQNTDGLGTFGPQRTISLNAEGAVSVFAGDMDGDGDLDALSASFTDDRIAWYENLNGAGILWARRTITTSADGARSVVAADIDGDGDLDALSASREDDRIAWYENTDGEGTFGPQRTISTIADGAFSVFAGDMDGDGDLDVLSASFDDDCIAWYENGDGRGLFTFHWPITLSADGATSVHAADLDGDGDLDVLFASFHEDRIAWHENTDAGREFGPQRTITTGADGALCVFTADMDGDGDLDVLSASQGNDLLAWHENTDGLGTFGPRQVVSTSADGAQSLFVGDLNGDMLPDVVSASSNDDQIAWYQNISTVPVGLLIKGSDED